MWCFLFSSRIASCLLCTSVKTDSIHIVLHILFSFLRLSSGHRRRCLSAARPALAESKKRRCSGCPAPGRGPVSLSYQPASPFPRSPATFARSQRAPSSPATHPRSGVLYLHTCLQAPSSILAPQWQYGYFLGILSCELYDSLSAIVSRRPHTEHTNALVQSPLRSNFHRPCTTGATSAAGVRRTMFRMSFLAVPIVTAAFSSSGASGFTNASAASRLMYSSIPRHPFQPVDYLIFDLNPSLVESHRHDIANAFGYNVVLIIVLSLSF